MPKKRFTNMLLLAKSAVYVIPVFADREISKVLGNVNVVFDPKTLSEKFSLVAMNSAH